MGRPESRLVYERFGVCFSAPASLAALPAAPGEPDFEVRFGAVKPRGEPLLTTSHPEIFFRAFRLGDGIFLEWESMRYHIDAVSATVDGDVPGVALRELLGPPWTVVLAFRGVETLHGSAVATPRGSVAFLGMPGTGKTTLAWHLTRRGHPLVADDLIPLGEDSTTPLAGLGELRLRADLAESEGVSSPEDANGKHLVGAEVSHAPPPLAAIVAFDEAATEVGRVRGSRAVEVVRQNFFSPILTAPGQALRRFAMASSLAERVPIFVAPPRTLDPQAVERLLEET